MKSATSSILCLFVCSQGFSILKAYRIFSCLFFLLLVLISVFAIHSENPTLRYPSLLSSTSTRVTHKQL